MSKYHNVGKWSIALKNCVFCLKIYNTLRGCRNFPAGSRQAASGARICETNIFGDI